LLRVLMPDAFHDVAACKDPPQCLLGTYEDYIRDITDWGAGTCKGHPQHLMWMHGPAGVGKSALTQSCAEIFAKRKTLVAAVFISQLNQKSNQNHILSSIAYQVATKVDPFANILDHHIQKDPTLLTKALSEQFHQLLVDPLEELQISGFNIDKGHIIILDSLDECADLEVQTELIEVIATSVCQQTMPFCWVLFSCSEHYIVNHLRSAHISPLSFHVELLVSHKIDYEILKYLVNELTKTGDKYSLSMTWFSEKDMSILVELAARLFIYAATVICFIGDQNLYSEGCFYEFTKGP
ncbi:hypothetical protein AN958_05554, partial [Leucoagaricus sp. SymC.cos]